MDSPSNLDSVTTDDMFGSGVPDSLRATKGSDINTDELSYQSDLSSNAQSETAICGVTGPRVQFNEKELLEARIIDGSSFHALAVPDQEQPNQTVVLTGWLPQTQPFHLQSQMQRQLAMRCSETYARFGREIITEEPENYGDSRIPLISDEPGECHGHCHGNPLVDKPDNQDAHLTTAASYVRTCRVREIRARCEMCRFLKLAEKKCFCCGGYVCIDCSPVHQAHYPLHITVPPFADFSPCYLCNAFFRRMTAGLRRIRKAFLYLCCCENIPDPN